MIAHNTEARHNTNSNVLRVIHIVGPAFGYTFTGTTKPILRLVQGWEEPDIQLSLWGSDYLERRKDRTHLWQDNRKHSRSVRLRWAILLLWMLIRRYRHYDLIHVHKLWWGGLLAPVLTRLFGKKAIYHMTLLGSDTPGAVAAQPLGRLKLWLFKRYPGVIGLTPALVEDCILHGFSSKLLTLPGFLVFDQPQLPAPERRTRARQRLGIPQNAQVLVFVGSIISRKGADVLVDLFLRAGKQRPDLWLLMVGAHTRAENPRLDEEFVARQRDKLEQAGLTERVVWAGLIRDEDELIETYLASDVFVFPTRAEGQGYVILEAMGSGLPVVCTHLPGVTDVMVIPDETGYLIDVDDLPGFIMATSKLLDNPELRMEMGFAGYRRATSYFGFETYCHKLAQFYRYVVADDKIGDAPHLAS